jgi:hypothetical protein
MTPLDLDNVAAVPEEDDVMVTRLPGVPDTLKLPVIVAVRDDVNCNAVGATVVVKFAMLIGPVYVRISRPAPDCVMLGRLFAFTVAVLLEAEVNTNVEVPKLCVVPVPKVKTVPLPVSVHVVAPSVNVPAVWEKDRLVTAYPCVLSGIDAALIVIALVVVKAPPSRTLPT